MSMTFPNPIKPGAAVPGRPGALVIPLLALLALTSLWTPRPASADGPQPFLGEVIATPYNFAPRGWAFCQGQLMSIAQNTALFSLLGTTYGGDGKSTFALPNLMGRVTIGAGQGPGLTQRFLGEEGGEESVTLLTSEMPLHGHQAFCDSTPGTSTLPTGALPARNAAHVPQYGRTPAVLLSPLAVGLAGGGQPHNNLPPYLTLNYIIALQGIYPARNSVQPLPQKVSSPPVVPAGAR